MTREKREVLDASLQRLDLGLYRAANSDLATMDDEALKAHFATAGWSERRVFAPTTTMAETMSMRWIRGQGVEIGAGRNPTPLFGNTHCTYADIRSDTGFGGDPELVFDLEGEQAPIGTNDFVIASHVLEHCDSFLRGLHNLTCSVKPGGVVYVVLPDKRFLHDQHWLPDYDFAHHATEWTSPLAHAEEHDRLFVGSLEGDVTQNPHAHIDAAAAEGLASGKLPAAERYLTHKHNYAFHGWLTIMIEGLKFLESPFVIEDCAFGRERMDCHFILVAR
jgi:SAM-dependent methyltransferase